MSNDPAIPSPGRVFLQALLPFSIATVFCVVLALIAYWVCNVDVLWGPLIGCTAMAGVAFAFLYGIVRREKWVEGTPLYKSWKFLFGDRLTKPWLFVLMLFAFFVGIGGVVAPALLSKPRPALAKGPGNFWGDSTRNPVSRMKAKSEGMSPRDSGFVDAVIDDMQASSPARRTVGIQAAARALAEPNSERRQELHDALVGLLMTGDNETQIMVMVHLMKCGTSGDIASVNDVLERSSNSAVRMQANETLRALREKGK